MPSWAKATSNESHNNPSCFGITKYFAKNDETVCYGILQFALPNTCALFVNEKIIMKHKEIAT